MRLLAQLRDPRSLSQEIIWHGLQGEDGASRSKVRSTRKPCQSW
jgi:hypothetical protein